MEKNDFPSCCGIHILSQFGNTITARETRGFTNEQIDRFLKEQIRQNYGNQALMAVLNSDQHKKMIKVFNKNGFRQIKRFYYQGHDRDLFILLRLTTENTFKK